ncbi:MAG: hypothetical protein MK105_01865 [Crocinitomicaceae bacterium]|nr:hypothetical protein [Crocinitomicaceae bacterium]
MYRNLFIIFVLAGSLSAILYFKPWESEKDLPALIQDRLPDGDIIGQTNILNLSQSLSKTLFYYKLPFRDFLSPDFMLSQGKNYGIDLQTPVYFFLNESRNKLDDAGMMLTVRDSSKVREGIDHLIKFVEIKDTLIYNTPVYISPQNEIYMAYGHDWMLFYKGKRFNETLIRVKVKRRAEISAIWRNFIEKNYLKENTIIAQLKTKQIQDYGVESALVSLENDSSSLILNTTITQFDSILFSLNTNTQSFSEQEFTKHSIKLNVDIERLKRNKKDPIYIALSKIGQKISFPTDEFLQIWNGELAFRQGGIQKIREKFIESELDDDFNVTEVVKYKNVKVSGFALHLTTNNSATSFVKSLFEKGIMTLEDRKVRLLYSPPLNFRRTDSTMMFYTGKYRPKLISDSINSVKWTVNYTPISIFLDSTDIKSVYGRVQVPLKKIISDNLIGF